MEHVVAELVRGPLPMPARTKARKVIPANEVLTKTSRGTAGANEIHRQQDGKRQADDVS